MGLAPVSATAAPSQSVARQPRAWVNAGGAQLVPEECSVHVSLHQSADTFYAKLPLDNDAGLDEDWWASTAPIPLTITAANDVAAGGAVTLLTGNVDEAQVDFVNRTVEVRGRDLTGALIDLKTSEKWQNLTGKDLITNLAGRVGLTVQFSGDSDKAGLQYDQDYNEISDLDSAWNVIVSSAQRLGCIAFVKGTILYIQPLDQPPTSFYTFTYQRPTAGQRAAGNFVSLYATRNLSLAKDVSLEIASWQHKQGKAIKSKFESKSASSGSDKLLYQFRGANLTKEQQDRDAKSYLKQTLTHERSVRASLPGDVNISALMGFRLSGTGTDFDQDYVMADIAHQFSLGNGYTMMIDAHSQDASRGEPAQLE